MRKDTVRLRREHKKDVERLLLLKQHHLGLAAASEGELRRLLAVGYGVDLAREDWELDLERGVLTRHTEVKKDERTHAVPLAQ